MSYPSIFRFWIEWESPMGWTTIDHQAGHSTLEAVAKRLEEIGAAGEPWASRQYRVVTPDGRQAYPEGSAA